MAPEIIDPPDDSRGTLTSKTDTYSFAMTCVEVRGQVLASPSIVFILMIAGFFLQIFAGQIPFEEIHRDPAVLRHILTGGRPEHMRNSPLAKKRGLDDFAWSLITRCWDPDHNERPRMLDVIKEIEDSNSKENSKEILQEMKSRGLLSSIPVRELTISP